MFLLIRYEIILKFNFISKLLEYVIILIFINNYLYLIKFHVIFYLFLIYFKFNYF